MLPLKWKEGPLKADDRKVEGFTLLEVLVALALLATAFTIIVGTFSTTVGAWKRGNELLDDLHHGDFIMEQLVASLRSAAYFDTAPDKYGFRLEDRSGGDYPADMISWVTSGTAFMPPGSPLANGLHRLVFTVEDNEDGDPAVAIRAFPHLADIEDDDEDPWFISTVVKGIDCRTYNLEEEGWDDDWEDTNAIPSIVEVTLYMDPLEKYGDPVMLSRMVEIPVAPMVTQSVNWAGSSDGTGKESSGQSKNTSRGTNLKSTSGGQTSIRAEK